MSQNLQDLTNEKGKKTAVVMQIKDYEKLLEDLDRLAALADRRVEETIPHEEFKRSLKRNVYRNLSENVASCAMTYS